MDDKMQAQIINNYMDRVSHEVRTMVSSILGLATIGENDVCNHERTAECFEGIKMTSKELLSYMDSVMSAARIQMGTSVGGEDCFTLDKLMKMISEYAGRKRMHTGIRLTSSVNGDTELALAGDLHRIRYVIAQFIDDAVRRNASLVDVRVSLSNMGETSYKVIDVVFVDDGIGIDEAADKRDYAYEVARDLIGRMNGELSVKSTYAGKNETDFTFAVKPYEEKTEGEAVPQYHEPINVREEFAGKTILLVEDNKINANVTKDVIELTGAKVEWAINGADAIRMILASREGYYDMVLMDLQMPGMDGYEATNAIRRLGRNDTGRMPILALTADVLISSIKRAIDMGMDNYIVKPIELESIMPIMRKYLS